MKISFGTKHGAEARRENGGVAGHSKYATLAHIFSRIQIQIQIQTPVQIQIHQTMALDEDDNEVMLEKATRAHLLLVWI